MSGILVHAAIRAIDWLADRTVGAEGGPAHQSVGRRGEEDAYFYLRRSGYIMVSRNFRSHLRKGEIDLIAWDGETLCFIEVKTRTSRDVKPAEAAVDRYKQRALTRVATEYLRCLPEETVNRFDVITVYYDGKLRDPKFELFRNAFSTSKF